MPFILSTIFFSSFFYLEPELFQGAFYAMRMFSFRFPFVFHNCHPTIEWFSIHQEDDFLQHKMER